MSMKKIWIIAAILALLLCLVACELAADGERTVKVMVSCSDGVTVTSQNPIEITAGEDAEFEVEFAEGYAVEHLSDGEIKNGMLTLRGVTRHTLVSLTAVNLGYDTNKEYYYFFSGASGDVSTVGNGAKAKAGTPVTVSANDEYRTFIGWSLGWRTNDRSKMLSSDRNFTFRLTPDLAGTKGVIKIFANYLTSDYFVYDANGGSVDMTSFNTAENEFYSCELDGQQLRVTMAESYRKVYETIALFFDDSTFKRDGYVLAEYNTKPDGTGTSYSLGSRFHADPEAEGGKIYCIWKKASEDFEYTDISIPTPAGMKTSHTNPWVQNGVAITKYTGSDSEVVIPEAIGGKKVIAISAGAISGTNIKTVVIPKTVQKVFDGAISGCSSLETIYYPDGLYYITDSALDAESYKSFKHLYVNATVAPRYANTNEGTFSIKLSRLLSSYKKNRIIVIAGSSTYQGLSSEYMEALLSGEYTVINFGTTRTTNGIIYLEAMQKLAHAGDIILYAPENSTYMMGENEIYWKTVRDLESMNNFWRHIDISNYKGVFSAFADFNANYKFKKSPNLNKATVIRYEHAMLRVGGSTNEFGEYIGKTDNAEYIDSYYITMNDKYKTKHESAWTDVASQEKNKNYKDPGNETWASILSSPYKGNVNRAIASAKLSGAKVYFTFCPVDADSIFDECRSKKHLEKYDEMMRSNFNFDGVLGKSANYVYAHEYFYDCAFHLNDTGRTLRTYRMYTDLCDLLGKTPRGFLSEGTTAFGGCVFEANNPTGWPLIKVDYLK